MHIRKTAMPCGLILSAALLLTGCLEDEGWTHKQKDVREAKKGWTITDVLTKVGKPNDKRIYSGVRTGWEEWVYPTGSIFFYRLVVKNILPRQPGSPPPPDTRRKSTWLVEVGDSPSDIEPKKDFGDF